MGMPFLGAEEVILRHPRVGLAHPFCPPQGQSVLLRRVAPPATDPDPSLTMVRRR